jgi:hypothetical protein
MLYSKPPTKRTKLDTRVCHAGGSTIMLATETARTYSFVIINNDPSAKYELNMHLYCAYLTKWKKCLKACNSLRDVCVCARLAQKQQLRQPYNVMPTRGFHHSPPAPYIFLENNNNCMCMPRIPLWARWNVRWTEPCFAPCVIITFCQKPNLKAAVANCIAPTVLVVMVVVAVPLRLSQMFSLFIVPWHARFLFPILKKTKQNLIIVKNKW